MKVLIIEDESLVAKDLTNNLKKIEPEIEIIDVLSSVKQSTIWFEQNEIPDLIFCDIQLSDGVSFDIFSNVKVYCPIIFTTAFNEYALKAFKLNSIDYLLKPIDTDELKAAIEKFKKLSFKQKDNNLFDLQNLIVAMQQKSQETKYKELFSAHYLNAIVPIKANQISHFVKDELLYIITIENKKMICDYKSLDELESLVHPTQFLRANRQNIIHVNAVESYKTHYSGKLIVKLKTATNYQIEISREKAAIFKNWLDR